MGAVSEGAVYDLVGEVLWSSTFFSALTVATAAAGTAVEAFELKDFDSMSVMSLVAFADETFGKPLTADKLQGMATVKDLMALIGLEQFE